MEGMEVEPEMEKQEHLEGTRLNFHQEQMEVTGLQVELEVPEDTAEMEEEEEILKCM